MDVIAHRGASKHYVENSLRAFNQAIKAGADGIEVDLRRSADGVIYCFHDHKLSRLTRGTGYFRRVASERISQLQLADGSPIPHFSEFIEQFMSKTRIILDIKSAHIESEILRQLGASAADPRLVYSSFNPNILKRIKDELPSARIALIVGPVRNVRMRLRMRSFLTRLLQRLDCQAVHLSRLLATGGLVKHLRNEGFRVAVWTIDDPLLAHKMADIGVDALMTNDPAEIVNSMKCRE